MNREQRPQDALQERTHHVLTLSARTPSALQQAAVNLARHLDHEPQQSLGDLAYTLQVGRMPYKHRLTLCATDRANLQELATQAGHSRADWLSKGRIQYGTTHAQPLKIAFLFSGQGSQFSGMAEELYASSTLVRDFFDECFAILEPYYPLPFQQYLFNSDYKSELDQMHISSVAMFMVEYALATLWMSWGIQPQFVIGHSLGEYAANCVAGGMSVRDALLTLVKRGHLMQQGTAPGGLLSINGTRELVDRYIDEVGDTVSLATVNGPQQFVVGGGRDAILRLQALLERDGVVHRVLPISTASHSVLMEPVLPEYRAYLEANIAFHPVEIPLVSNLTGQVVEQALDATYWCRHLRETVQFSKGIETLLAAGVNVFLEVGPHPVLTTLVDSLPLADDVLVLASMSRKEPQWQTLHESIGRLWIAGAPFDWHAFQQDFPRRRVHAPAYPFEGTTCWNHVDRGGLHQSGSRTTESELPTSELEDSGTDMIEETRSCADWVRLIWREVLGVAHVEQDDHFMHLGGESLHMIQVQSRLRKALHVQVPLADLHRYGTFHELTAYLEALVAANQAAQPTESAVVQTAQQVPLSPVQQMFRDLPGADIEHFFLPIALDISEAVDEEQMRQTLQLLHAHHDMLRAVYHYDEGGTLVQTILPPQDVQIKLTTHDLSDLLDGDDKYAAYLELETRLAHDLRFEKGLMNGAMLVKWKSNQYRFLWVVSHLYTDTVTTQILTEDLLNTYQSLQQGQHPELLPSATYAQWVANSHAFVASPDAQPAEAYWLQHLPSLQSAPLRVDDPLGSNTYADIRSTFVSLDEATTRELRAGLTKQCGTTFKEVLFALVSRALARWQGAEQVVFGVNGHGREDLFADAPVDLSRTAGYFVNFFPLVTTVEAEENVAATVARVKEHVLALPHGGTSFNMLRYLSQNPEVQAAFAGVENPPILLNFHGELRNLSGEEGLWKRGRSSFLEQPITCTFPYRLLLLCHIEEGCLHLSFNYSPHVFQTASIERLANLFRSDVEEVAAGPLGLTSAV